AASRPGSGSWSSPATPRGGDPTSRRCSAPAGPRCAGPTAREGRCARCGARPTSGTCGCTPVGPARPPATACGRSPPGWSGCARTRARRCTCTSTTTTGVRRSSTPRSWRDGPVPMRPPPEERVGRAMDDLIRPMLATPGTLPADDSAYAFETKWDGVRAIAYVRDATLRLYSRNDAEVTAAYPELAPLAAALGGVSAVLDGEVVGFDGHGRVSFEAL